MIGTLQANAGALRADGRPRSYNELLILQEGVRVEATGGRLDRTLVPFCLSTSLFCAEGKVIGVWMSS